jgi:dihydrofolate synthase/folylpolyglutamate synthase
MHQVENAATAVAALRRLGTADRDIRAGMAATRWPGRLERVGREPDFYLDGAHNPAGARRLVEYIARFHGGRKVWMIFGAMRDKAVGEIAGILFPAADEIVLTAPGQKRALEPEAILEFAPAKARVIPCLGEALETVRREAVPGDVVFLTGSLYLVGEARALLVQ